MNGLPRGVARIGKVGAVVLAVVSLLYLSLFLRWPAEQHIGYWQIDDLTLGVVVLDAPNLECQVANVEEASEVEASNAVRVHAQCSERVVPVPESGMAQQYVFQVILKAPLEGRAVYDGSGTPAQLCAKPAPNCWYSG